MCSADVLEPLFGRISIYREGARYCKMDLHTHTPASECTSFDLPPTLARLFPKKTKKRAAASYDKRYRFLRDLVGEKNPFEKAYSELNHLHFAPDHMETGHVKAIADAWLHDIDCALGKRAKRPGSAERKTRERYVANALADLRRYLASRLFPAEYVMRCHIEGLQLVALTDHNHPGYIVPRLPRLGTWFSEIERVNERYRKAIREGDPEGKLRTAITDRLTLAADRLRTRFDEVSRSSPEIEEHHRDDVQKALSSISKRREHVKERTGYWRKERNAITPLVVLPGVELTVSDVHLLAVFPPMWYVSGRIGGILRSIGIPEEHWGRGFLAAASVSVQDATGLIDAEGGILIPAHSNSDFKGLLRLFKKGLALNKVLEHPSLLALEIKGGSVKAKVDKTKAKDACETLHWLDSGRSRPTRTKPLCFVKGSDAHECRIELDGTGEDLGKRFTYVKIDIRPRDTADEVFRSLRLALLSGQSRVIEFPVEDGYNYAPPAGGKYRVKKTYREKLLKCATGRPTILGIAASGKGAYTDGLAVRFSPYLNCVVGSGGKSTLVRLVGYAFGALGFMEGKDRHWLPEVVRAFWRDGDNVYCIERSGRHPDPKAAAVETVCYKRTPQDERKWTKVSGNVCPQVDVWPSADVQNKKSELEDFEDDVIRDLVRQLRTVSLGKSFPLLVNQPRDIFNGKSLFENVLARPYLKYRQVIWSTGSPNVPTALDAEKIIVTREASRGKRMDLVCGGDLHEDEIREQFLNEFEGGWLGFARRSSLYDL